MAPGIGILVQCFYVMILLNQWGGVDNIVASHSGFAKIN